VEKVEEKTLQVVEEEKREEEGKEVEEKEEVVAPNSFEIKFSS